MSLGKNDYSGEPERPDGVPPTDRRKIAAAAVCLAIPVIGLMAVPTYAKDGPELFSFPFFFWYQFLWVFLCSGFTWTAYRLVLSARPKREVP
ncbi:hypothetical protein BH09ACT12_BH09ACT12_14920 [soil metagenome]